MAYKVIGFTNSWQSVVNYMLKKYGASESEIELIVENDNGKFYGVRDLNGGVKDNSVFRLVSDEVAHAIDSNLAGKIKDMKVPNVKIPDTAKMQENIMKVHSEMSQRIDATFANIPKVQVPKINTPEI